MANSLIELLGELSRPVIERFFPDQGKAQEFAQALQLEMIKNETLLAQGQLEINKAEAANPDRFISGWRPFIGWVCGGAMAFNFIAIPFVYLMATLAGQTLVVAPLDMSQMWPVLTALLGLGGLRTYEKVKGTTLTSG